MTFWQVAAGSAGRDYTEEFLRFGMAFVGGSDQIKAMSRVRAGDTVLLKRGMSTVVAVGEVIERDGRCSGKGDKDWLKDFDGWNLPAYCYVRWHHPEKPIDTSGLTRATIQEVWQTHLHQIARETLRDVPPLTITAPDPDSTHKVEDAEILSFLIHEGLRPSSADELTNTLRRIRLLARYYYDLWQWNDVREHETRTFLIVPLLLALGWAEQQMKIELGVKSGRVDVACFSRPYRRDKNGVANDHECVLLLESKGFGSGLNYAPAQAHAYATHFPSCRVVVVSNGYCYKTYERVSDGTFSSEPSAYLNLLNPQDRYPLAPDRVGGAKEVLHFLLPGSSR